MTTSVETETQPSRDTVAKMLGRIKWFNNKAGYGFITVSEGDRSGKDIFVHHSGIKVSSEQYRYLVQGEYVEFSLDNTPSGQHEVQAKDVCGINGGMLMCETRRDFRQSRTSYNTNKDSDEVVPRSVRPPSGTRPPSGARPQAGSRAPGPRAKKEWTMKSQQ
jgi:CspA family cold shock protein